MFVPGKFYGIDFITGGNPIDGPESEYRIVNYLGALNDRHLFDNCSTVVVLGPLDEVVNGPADRPFGVSKVPYQK